MSNSPDDSAVPGDPTAEGPPPPPLPPPASDAQTPTPPPLPPPPGSGPPPEAAAPPLPPPPGSGPPTGSAPPLPPPPVVGPAGSPAKSSCGKRLLGCGIVTVLVIVAIVIAVVLSFTVLKSDLSVDATAQVTMGQVERTEDSVVIPLAVTNTTENTRDFYIDIAVRSPSDTAYYNSTTTSIDNVAPGATGSGSAGFFFDDIPADAVYTVSDATGFCNSQRSSGGRSRCYG